MKFRYCMVQQWLGKATSQSHEPKNMHIKIQEQGQKKGPETDLSSEPEIDLESIYVLIHK